MRNAVSYGPRLQHFPLFSFPLSGRSSQQSGERCGPYTRNGSLAPPQGSVWILVIGYDYRGLVLLPSCLLYYVCLFASLYPGLFVIVFGFFGFCTGAIFSLSLLCSALHRRYVAKAFRKLQTAACGLFLCRLSWKSVGLSEG